MKKKKIIIGIMIGFALIAAFPLLVSSMRKNDATTIKTTLEVLGEDGVYRPVESNTNPKGDIFAALEDEKAISDLLIELDWIDEVLISLSTDSSSLTGIFDTNREPSPQEVDNAVAIITSRVDSIKEENVFIIDRNEKVISPKRLD
ncbi:MAG: hypothetical protein FWG90_06550 [Oscillospiraceae bacterium]|nr:hypothetical protein [Oscillospiraceae bacterium]